jgi:ABC-type branched-subunit amino acid transport system ATPase component
LTTPSATDGLIQASKLTKRFGAFTAVDNVDIDFARTGITALIGPNGAGKTTLFNLITGQITPDEGRVLLDGVDVTKSAAHVMARHGIGRSFQDVRLFGAMSVRENVATYAQKHRTSNLALTLMTPLRQRRMNQEAIEKADEVLRYLKISNLSAIRADTLGFAQQKLVAIARLLALSPRILFLDEPASGLDHAGRQTLSSTINRLAADGYSVCFVEHNTHLVRELATRVLFLSQGRILADGDPDAVFSDPRLAETYLGLV